MFCRFCSQERNLTIPFFLISVFLEDLDNLDNQQFKNFLYNALLCANKKEGFTEHNKRLLGIVASSLEDMVPPISNEDIYRIKNLVDQGELFNENETKGDLNNLGKLREKSLDIEKQNLYRRKDDYSDNNGSSSRIIIHFLRIQQNRDDQILKSLVELKKEVDTLKVFEKKTSDTLAKQENETKSIKNQVNQLETR
ncbi:41966_t:CDS:2, partial [Gigaspora margarita]